MSEHHTSDAVSCIPRGLEWGGSQQGAPALQTKPLAPGKFGPLFKIANNLSAQATYRPDQVYKREGSMVSRHSTDETERSKILRGARNLEAVDPFFIFSGVLLVVVLAFRNFQLVGAQITSVVEWLKWH